MNKFFTSLGLMAAVSLQASAANQVFNTPEMGDLNGVSVNGRFAAIGDMDNNIAYLWDAENPNVFTNITPELSNQNIPSGQRIIGAVVYDVDNYGDVVGAIYYADGKSYPAIYSNGVWTQLEIPDDAINHVECVAINAKGTIITGYAVHAYYPKDGSDPNGQYFPIQWFRQPDGSYSMTSYGRVDFSDHNGFFPSCQSQDGRIIGGTLFCGKWSSIPAFLIDGKLKIFDTIEFTYEPWIYKGEYYCGRDEDGQQIWTDDPNDPRIVLYTEVFIDGYHDGDKALEGQIVSCDDKGNFYGYRTLVSNVSDDGMSATLKTQAAIYNTNTEEWTYSSDASYFTCGNGEGLVFGGGNTVFVDGEKHDVCQYFDITTTSESVGIAKCSGEGKVLGGVRAEFAGSIGDYFYFPYVVVTDGAFDSVKTVYGGENPFVIVRNGGIDVVNASEAVVYDMEGHIVSRSLKSDLNAGMYVVVAGGLNVKVLVK